MNASSLQSGDPRFDGHLERPFESLSASERLWWLEETMRFAGEARPVVPGGTGVLRRVAWRVDAGPGRSPAPPRIDGLGVFEAELVLTIDDRDLRVARMQATDRAEVSVATRRDGPLQDSPRSVDLSATAGWSDLVGQFVVLRYLTADRSRLGIELERDRPVVVFAAGTAAIEIRRNL